MYEKEKRFVPGMEFSKWLNNEFIPNNPEFKWVKEVSSKSVKQSIMDADRAFKDFFQGKKHFPKFKKKSKSDVKMYFVKTDCNTIIPCERHRIKIPTLGWVRIKEKGYIPTTKSGYTIKSGTVSIRPEDSMFPFWLNFPTPRQAELLPAASVSTLDYRILLLSQTEKPIRTSTKHQK